MSVMRGYEIIKLHHFGHNLHGHWLRTREYGRSFNVRKSLIVLSVNEAEKEVKRLNEERYPSKHQYCSLDLTSEDVFSIKYIDEVFAETGEITSQEELQTLYEMGVKP